MKNKYIIGVSVGIVAGLIVVVIVSLCRPFFARPQFSVQISPHTQGSTVTIGEDSVQLRPNRDGILFVQIRGTTKGDVGAVEVHIQPVDVPDWFEQTDVQHSGGVFIVRAQLGSVEWPVRGGERYFLRVKAGEDTALATITVQKL